MCHCYVSFRISFVHCPENGTTTGIQNCKSSQARLEACFVYQILKLEWRKWTSSEVISHIIAYVVQFQSCSDERITLQMLVLCLTSRDIKVPIKPVATHYGWVTVCPEVKSRHEKVMWTKERVETEWLGNRCSWELAWTLVTDAKVGAVHTVSHCVCISFFTTTEFKCRKLSSLWNPIK